MGVHAGGVLRSLMQPQLDVPGDYVARPLQVC